MPTYAYRCPKCGHTEEVVKAMAHSNSVENCPKCFDVMRRDYGQEHVRCTADSYYRELHSDALAIHPDQREEHQRKFPDVPLDSESRPILRNYRQHNEYIEKRGIVKPSQRKELI